MARYSGKILTLTGEDFVTYSVQKPYQEEEQFDANETNFTLALRIANLSGSIEYLTEVLKKSQPVN